MICLVLFLAVASSAMAGYADSTSGSNKVGNGYGYGYSGTFTDGNGGYAGAPLPPFPQFDFNNLLQQYFDSLRKYHEQIAAQAQQGAGFAGYGFPGGFPAYAGFGAPGLGAGTPGGFPGFGGAFTGTFGGGQEGAAASAAIGPQGVHQTASLFPENPNQPNIDNRFGSTAPGGGNGFYSVSTSSQSGNSNIDGKPTSFHQATTTVNDNGKVTTYTVKKP